MNRVVARLAWREVKGHPWRSVLVALLVMLPVVVVNLLSTAMNPVPPSQLEVTFGSASARIVPLEGADGRCHQLTLGEAVCPSSGSGAGKAPSAAVKTPDPAALDGLGGTLERETRGTLEMTFGGLTSEVTVAVVDRGAVHSAERWMSRSGAIPADGLHASGGLMSSTSLVVGDELTVAGQRRRLVAEVIGKESEILLVVDRSDALAPQVTKADDATTVVWHYGEPLTRAAVDRLNEAGWGVVDRVVAERDGGLSSGYDGGIVNGVYAISVGSLLGLLTAVICAAAFTIGVSQQRRSLALLAATGAAPSTLRRVVTLQGLLTGLAGSVPGAVLGVWLARRIVAWLDQGSDSWPLSSVVHPWVVVGSILVGTVAATAAAWWPGRQVARQDVWNAVRQAQGASGPARRPTWQVAAAGVSVLFALVGVTNHSQISVGNSLAVEQLITPACVSIALLFLAVLGSLGWILQRLSKLPVGGVTSRLALRELVRSRGRSSSSAAACLAVATLASAALLSVGSIVASYTDAHVPELPRVVVELDADPSGGVGPSPRSIERALALSEQRLGRVDAWSRTRMPMICAGSGTDRGCQAALVVETDPMACADQTCTMRSLEVEILTDEVHQALTGQPIPDDLRQVLDDGGLVVPDAGLVDGGRARLVRSSFDVDDRPATPTKALVREGLDATKAYVSAATAKKFAPKAVVEDGDLLVRLSTEPTADQVDDLRRDLATAGLARFTPTMRAEVAYSTGYESGLRLMGVMGVVMMAVAALATSALSVHDARTTHVALARVGATSWTLRQAVTVQALLTSLVGSVLGFLVALGPMAVVMLGSRGAMSLGIPWGWVGLVVVGAPMVAAAVVLLVWRPPDVRAEG